MFSDNEKEVKSWNKDVAYAKISKYALFQDRCVSEIIDKLFKHKIYGKLQVELVDKLFEEDILNEERYTTSFVRGKSRLKWGIQKIKMSLSAKKIPVSIINKVIEENMDELNDVTQLSLNKLVAGRVKNMRKASIEECSYQDKMKITQYLLSKGYTIDKINEALLK
jgi:regulatory protein